MKNPRADIVSIYARIMTIIFQRLSPTFGERTIAAIAKNVLARQSKDHPILSYVSVSDRGVDWTEFSSHMDGVSEDEIAESLEEFLDEFFEALSNLIGRLIVGKLFKEAEEMAKRGENE